jgi:predicted nucleic acid-binding protein
VPTVLIDANVLLDILIPDPMWERWSSDAVAEVAETALLVINPIIYAEVSIGFERIEDLDAALPEELQREDLPWDAGFLAGKAFLNYRRQGGSKRTPLPDFYIGAHAAVRGYSLLTRDDPRYRTYFPKLALIIPPPPGRA